MPAEVTYVPGSTKLACHLVGFPHSPSHDDYGVEGNGLGYSFSFDGKIWWLFGDTHGTAYFHNYPNKTPRYPKDKSLYDNDSIATSVPTAPGACPELDFITAGSPVPGAFSSPSVSPDPLTGAAQLSLRTDETPIAGIAVGHSLFAAFTTDNPYDAGLKPNCVKRDATCLGRSTRSVMAELVNDTTALQFKGLFDISAPAVRYADGAKFVELSMAASPDGQWVYLFGVPGGRSYDFGSPYLARLPDSVAEFNAANLQFLVEDTSAGPVFKNPVPSAPGTVALQLFQSGCMSDVSVEYNAALARWMMIYACRNTALPGIYMTTALEPWGPWSAPQRIFDPDPNPALRTGYCYFLHSTEASGVDDCQHYTPPPPNPATRGDTSNGIYFFPTFVAGWTTSSVTKATSGSEIESTFYYTISTFNPYGEVIVKSSVVEARLSPPPPPIRCGSTGTNKKCS